MSESRGRSSETSFRLCSRAPRMMSWSATESPDVLAVRAWIRSNKCSPSYPGRTCGHAGRGDREEADPTSLRRGTDRTPRVRRRPVDPRWGHDRRPAPPRRDGGRHGPLPRHDRRPDRRRRPGPLPAPGLVPGPRHHPRGPQRRRAHQRAARGARPGSRTRCTTPTSSATPTSRPAPAGAAAELRADAVAACGRWVQAANEVHRSHLDAPGCRLPGGEHLAGVPRGRHALDRGRGAPRRPRARLHRRRLAAALRRPPHEAAPRGSWPTTRSRCAGARPTPVRPGPPGDGPEVTGPASAIVWWLLGRGTGEGLACSEGRLPDIGRWR